MIELLDQSRVLITGASGLIGINLIKHIHQIASTCQIIALGHSVEKAKRVQLTKTISYDTQLNPLYAGIGAIEAMWELSLFCSQCHFIGIS